MEKARSPIQRRLPPVVARPNKTRTPSPAVPPDRFPFSIVGSGASAGELEALEPFLKSAALPMEFIPGDVGRAVTDLASALLYPNLVADAKAVLATLAFVEKQISTKTGNWFSVRIMPYRTMDNVIDGLVITFLDITVHRRPAAGLGGEPKPTRPTELKP